MGIEISRPEYKIRFEPGIHDLTESQDRATIQRFLSGDLTTSIWPSQVSKRISQYKPYLIGLDSVTSIYNEQGTRFNWVKLPGRPHTLSGRNEIFVTAGDLIYTSVARNKDEPMLPSLSHVDDDTGKEVAAAFIMDNLITSVITGLATLACVKARVKFSRRVLLRLGSLALLEGLYITTLGRFASLVGSLSEDSNVTESLHLLTELTKPRFLQSTWLKGRTALVISKTQQSGRELHLPTETPLGVVMGTMHDYDAKSLIDDPSVRMNAIRAYAEQFVSKIFPIAMQVGYLKDNPEEKQFAKDVTASLFAQTDIFRILDPGTNYSPNPTDTIRPLIQHHQRFLCPEICEALQDFGDATKYA